ncbi:MAG: mannitol 2-dehydrogenase [Frankiales bacterium]|jgi:mannitol 2-dehydrogenase|nr:mannitol 2-dehydrogenase [Frankiales bacterium]
MSNNGVPLSTATLGTLDPAVKVPEYDRDAVSVGIVHFGVGGFHRAHQAMYGDRLMNDGKALDWGICGVGVMPSDLAMRDALDAQDCLYTVVVKHADGRLEPRVIGSIVRYLYAPDDPEAVLTVLADERTRIVSLTVTEGGYNVDPVTGGFDTGNEAVAQDARGDQPPATVFGLVVEALRRRRAQGLAPFTVMSCDNIPGNGDLAKAMFAAFADLVDPGLGGWIRSSVSFPNSMVDRITPVTAESDRALLVEQFGLADRWPVVCEAYTQWVLQEDFPTGRPPWQDAGVQLVDDVEPYELMKLRLLNASHQAMAYVGYLSGHRFAHEAATDPAIVEFLSGYMDQEGTPTLPEVPGVDLAAYKRSLIERFANPQVRDTLARLCAESSDRIPKWLLPVVRANLATGGEIRRSAAVVASWARYAEGTDEQGEPIVVVDRLSDELISIAARQKDDPLAFIENRALFGDLAENEVFADAFRRSLRLFHEVGAHRTVELVNESLRTGLPLPAHTRAGG